MKRIGWCVVVSACFQRALAVSGLSRSRLPELLGIVLGTALVVGGCGDIQQPLAPNSKGQAGAAGSGQPAAPAVGRPSKEQAEAWLATGLPAFQSEIAQSPAKLSNPQIAPNEWGQEMLLVTYERPTLVRTLPAEVNLVLLPASGGRFKVSINNGILVEPRSGGTLRGITQYLLNHRGQVGVGMRVYLEMKAASIKTTAQPLERVSDVVWLGSEDQLAQAIAKGPPPSVAANAGISEPSLQPAPAGRIAKGTPLWMRCGDRWARGTAFADSDQDQIQLMIYLVRRDKPYMPWSVELSRAELRIEPEALAEFQHDPNSFRDLADAMDRNLARQGAPNVLKAVDPANLAVGTPVLDYWNGMFDPCRTTGPVQGDAVAIQRVGLDNAQMNKSVKPLFLDPFGDPAP